MKDVNFYYYFKKELMAHVIVKDNIVTITNNSLNKILNPFIMNTTPTQIMRVLSLRCFEPERPDKLEILEDLGLSAYDIVDIIHKTHGKMGGDYFWIKFEGEDITYEELFD